ncbi:MAG: permease [Myxococcota bacterium]
MTTLLLSLLAMAVAPLLDRAVGARPRVAGFADGLIQVVVGGILLVHVLPFGLATAGWPALFALGGGAMVGVLAHRIPGGERSAGALAVLALLLHAGIDGAALATPDTHGHDAGEGMLAWAVVLHTVPVGLATWRISRQRAGAAFAFGLLVATAAVTTAGWLTADTVFHGASPAALGLAQCAVAGALLHVLGHAGEGLPRRPAGWGGLVGVGIVILLVLGDPIPLPHAGELGAESALVTLLLASAPALLLGYLAAGALHAFAPAPLVRWLNVPRDPPEAAAPAHAAHGPVARLGAAARGAFVGVPVPVCSCGALPVYRGLLARGAPPAAALAFLVAGPEVGVGTVFVSVPLLGGEITALRVAGAVVVALVVGLVVAPVIRRGAPQPTPAPRARPEAFGARVRGALRFGLVDVVDHTAPWVLVGLGIAALAEPLLAGDAMAALPGPLAVVAAALVGIPAYVCASGATPLVAVLLHKGLSTGAALAFLVTGPATNVATFVLLRRLHGARVAAAFGGVVTLVAVGLGLAVDHLLPALSAPALHATSLQVKGPFEIACAVGVLALFAAALVRNGAAGFLEPLLHPHAHADAEEGRGGRGGHEHGHHAHTHGGHGHGGHAHGE